MLLYSYLITLGCVSLITFFFFAYDKIAAKKNGNRVPEVVLLTLSALGGGVGGMLGKLCLRHKSNAKRKPHFAVVLLLSVVLQTALAVYLIVL